MVVCSLISCSTEFRSFVMVGFMICRRGSWRSLDLDTGRLIGARSESIQFLTLSGGRAIKLCNKEVLRHLRRFACGKRSRVWSGAELRNVEVERNKQEPQPTSQPEPRRRSSSRTVDKRQFAKSLGLGPSEAASTASSSPRTLRNTVERPAIVARLPYDEEEDKCIVRWLAAESSRVKGVGGVLVWRELSQDFPKLCRGHARTWHSLKNRYLRMLLPSLRNPDSELSSLVSQKCRSILLAGKKKKSSLESSLVKKLTNVRSGASSRRARVSSKEKKEDVPEEPVRSTVNTRSNRRKLYNVNK